jgi:hypothetical protein
LFATVMALLGATNRCAHFGLSRSRVGSGTYVNEKNGLSGSRPGYPRVDRLVVGAFIVATEHLGMHTSPFGNTRQQPSACSRGLAQEREARDDC